MPLAGGDFDMKMPSWGSRKGPKKGRFFEKWTVLRQFSGPFLGHVGPRGFPLNLRHTCKFVCPAMSLSPEKRAEKELKKVKIVSKVTF